MERGLERRAHPAHPVLLKTAEANVSDVLPSPASTIPSSPASSDGDRRFSLLSIKSMARRSMSSRESSVMGTSPRSQSLHVRKLSKSRPQSSASLAMLAHDSSHGSITDTPNMTPSPSLSPSPPPSRIDWQSQKVEGLAPLESDTQFMRARTPYLVVTSEYVVKVKSRADVGDLFPSFSERPVTEKAASNHEPLVVIPLSAVVSVFVAESTKPSFGTEVWWRASPGFSFHHASFFFNLPGERDEQMHHIARAMRAGRQDETGHVHPHHDVLGLLVSVCESEEQGLSHDRLEVFPVIPRANLRKEYIKKMEDSSKKVQESPAFYLVLGTYRCHFVVIQRAKSGEPTCQHRSFGLVTLEKLRGDWTVHEERFNISFRNPFAPHVTLELASRFYRQIIRVFGMADRFLKPVWPQVWQATEIFHISGLQEPQYLVPREDFGSVRRTLDAYTPAYQCDSVDWEINWKTRFPPEFRVLPAKDGSRYSPLQLLAVLRALRYNDYFNSLSFRDVDLSPLWGILDQHSVSRSHVAYLSRSCVTLDTDEIQTLKQSSVLHQEFHALAFCSETTQQIDFTNSSAFFPPQKDGGRRATPNLQFLTPILNLLRSDITKCANLILAGNALTESDLEDIVETLSTGTIQALDVSSCSLCEKELRALIAPILDGPQPLWSLNLSENPGRLPAGVLPQMLHNLVELRELNLRGSLQGEHDISGTLIPYEVLDRLHCLQELDISGFKINPATLRDLGSFLRGRTQETDGRRRSGFRRLVLNHCGITGDQVARLCRAIGGSSDMHLSISGNLLEDGIEDLADVIRESKVPTGLYMDVVEFKEESNYAFLLRALAETKSISLLSLAGTAPTPSIETIHQSCSSEVVEALEYFFAHNTSVRYLDLSGFSGKLEDGQLARGFARSLIGLSRNKTMTHLKIRNQNLHDDVGILGQVLSENRTLRVVDCQDNKLNLTCIKFLVSRIRDNDKIVDFPFPPSERKAIWKHVLQGMRKSSYGATCSMKHGPAERLKGAEELMVHDVLEAQFAELDGYLDRNRRALEESLGYLLDFDMSVDSLEDMEDSWMALKPREVGAEGQHAAGSDSEEATPTAAEQHPRRPTVRSSYVGGDSPLPASYHVRYGDDGMESPTETLDPASEISTPPEVSGPEVASTGPDPKALDDLTFKQMMHEFKESGFNST